MIRSVNVDPLARHSLASVALTLLLAMSLVAPAAAKDADVVTTKSGDRLVGEIQRLDKKVLILSTPYSDSDFAIDWDEVSLIESGRQFVVETFAGLRLTGSLGRGQTQGMVVVGGETIALADLAMVRPFEASLWARFDAGMDFGYSMVKANDATQLTAGGNLAYRGERNVDALAVNVFRNSQSGASTTERWELGNDYRYLLGDRWYLTTTQSFLHSDEQALDLRTTVGLGAGRYQFRAPDQYFAYGAGLAWTRENYKDPAMAIRSSAEAYLAAELMTERLRFADLLTRMVYYPSLTVHGRQRATYKFDLDFNLPGDFYFRVSLFDNYDSRPPAALSKNDWGWSNAFGLEF